MMRDKSKDMIKKVMIEYMIDKDGFSLEDQGDKSRLSRSVRQSLQPGEYVKLGFRFDTKGMEDWDLDRDWAYESMWVKICSTSPQIKRYTGEIDNISVLRPDLYGKVIEFGPENIFDILKEEEVE